MARRWFGARLVGSTSINPFTNDEFVGSLSLNNVNIHDGDTIVRTLFAWRLETGLVDNSSGLQRGMWPTWISLAFSPDPDGEPIGDPNAPGGAKLFRAYASWVPQNWTDGSLYGTRFVADSMGYQSSQGQRVIQDKTVDTLDMGWSMTTGETGIDDTSYIPERIFGWVQVEYLVDSH